MSDKHQQTVDNIVESILNIPWEERETILRGIEHNPFFCWNCGYGSKEHPNTRCQCWNDE